MKPCKKIKNKFWNIIVTIFKFLKNLRLEYKKDFFKDISKLIDPIIAKMERYNYEKVLINNANEIFEKTKPYDINEYNNFVIKKASEMLEHSEINQEPETQVIINIAEIFQKNPK